MPATILTTKILIPPARPNPVPRPELFERLDAGLRPGHRLTLLSAPPGFGKTTLLSEWIHHTSIRRAGVHAELAWLTLERSENDPARFCIYLIAALQRVAALIGQPALDFLQSPVRAESVTSLETAWKLLINDLAATVGPLVIVLDDYSLIDTEGVHNAIEFLLEHLPPQVHFVIASRADLPFNLSLLRARGQLTELRATDLRFSRPEAGEFLRHTMGLPLSDAQVAVLEERTEGWVTGLQLAAIALSSPGRVSGEETFSGSNRYVLDYLAEEVLRSQPETVQHYLLATCILDRMSGPLCEALTGQAGGQAMLERLEAANLFILPLDQKRTWYRYHQLFVSFLRSFLARQSWADVPGLHRQASLWFEQHGLLAEAVEHALQSGEVDLASRLVEAAARQALMPGETGRLLRWLEALPAETVEARPRLCLAKAWALLISGRMDEGVNLLERPSATALLVDASQSEILGEAAAIQAIYAVLHGDGPAAAACARRALDHLPASDHFLKVLAALNLGLAEELNNQLEAAGQAYRLALELAPRTADSLLLLPVTSQLADLMASQGRLIEAVQLYRQVPPPARGNARTRPMDGMAYTRLGSLLYELNDLSAAADCLITGIELGRQWESSDFVLVGSLALAQVRLAQDRPEEACRLLDQANQAAGGRFVSLETLRSAQATRARLEIQIGRQQAVADWVARPRSQVAGGLAHLSRLEGIVQARLCLAQGDPALAESLVAPLLDEAETAGHLNSVIELLVLQALINQALGKSLPALMAMRRALQLGLPNGFRRVFLDEGQSAGRLVAACRPDFNPTELLPTLAQLLHAFHLDKPEVAIKVEAVTHPVEPLIEPLSKRELEVLELTAGGFSNRRMAERLVVAESTIKSHIKSIYQKLGAHNRIQAVARGRELHLIR